jgi:hypothetical protein
MGGLNSVGCNTRGCGYLVILNIFETYICADPFLIDLLVFIGLSFLVPQRRTKGCISSIKTCSPSSVGQCAKACKRFALRASGVSVLKYSEWSGRPEG